MPAGRPTKYKEEYTEQVFKLCLLGATDERLADFFDISESTLNLWKKEYPKFSEAIKKGKDEADARVAESLYNRALGYSHPEDKIFNVQGKEGPEPLIVPTIKHYPPDATSAIFWLKNRQKAQWRDKQDLEHTGPDGGPINSKWEIEIVHTDAKTKGS